MAGFHGEWRFPAAVLVVLGSVAATMLGLHLSMHAAPGNIVNKPQMAYYRISGTVVSVSLDDRSLVIVRTSPVTHRHFQRTVHLADGSAIRRRGRVIPLSDLKPGDRILLRSFSVDDDGLVRASRVTVQPPAVKPALS